MKIDNRGFTLIELLAVMIILISISLVAVGGITESLKNRDIKECKEQVELAISAAKIYFSLNDVTSVTVGELNSSDFSKVDYFKDDKKIDKLNINDKIDLSINGYKYIGSGDSCILTTDIDFDDNSDDSSSSSSSSSSSPSNSSSSSSSSPSSSSSSSSSSPSSSSSSSSSSPSSSSGSGGNSSIYLSQSELFGDIDLKMIDNRGDDIYRKGYLLYTPTVDNKDKKVPLIVWLHGSFGTYNANTPNLKNTNFMVKLQNWKLEGFNAYVLAPVSNGEWDNKANGNEITLKKLLDYVVDKYNIDERKIILAGHSMGGEGVLYMAHHYPNYFSKLVVMSSLPPADEVDIGKLNHIPTRGYTEANNGSVTRYMTENFASVFSSSNVFVFQCSHATMPQYAFDDDKNGDGRSDLIEWMLTG